MADSSSESEVEVAPRLKEVQPYQFEPVRNVDADKRSTTLSSPESNSGAIDRCTNTDWCACGFCQSMGSQVESCCCAEFPEMWQKVLDHRSQSSRDSQSARCITEVAGFEPVCLNPYVLETAYLHFKQEHGIDLETTQHEKYRYTAYRQLLRWCYGFLGRSIRVPLPSCAVLRIRAEYSSEGNIYRGFQWPTL